jgi:hypothetical protein
VAQRKYTHISKYKNDKEKIADFKEDSNKTDEEVNSKCI